MLDDVNGTPGVESYQQTREKSVIAGRIYCSPKSYVLSSPNEIRSVASESCHDCQEQFCLQSWYWNLVVVTFPFAVLKTN
jgi:hypothetical protein